MSELEQKVMTCVKNLIHLERPILRIVDGPWKEYVKRCVAAGPQALIRSPGNHSNIRSQSSMSYYTAISEEEGAIQEER